jgi:hypothetical protein
MKIFGGILIAVLAFLFACNSENPISELEATDEEAIFNVVIIDNARLSDMQAFPTDIPDTMEFMANPDPLAPLYWHAVDTVSERFQVSISDLPVESPVGLVYEASVLYTKTWEGTFNILAYNSFADSLERYTKDFVLNGSRSARCQRWGVTNQRRGWLLTKISDAHFAAGAKEFLRHLYYHSESNDDSVFNAALKSLDSIPRFNAEETVSITFEIPETTDQTYIFVPVNNFSYELATPESAPGGGYQVTVTMPSISRMYGQFRFLVVNAGQFGQPYAAAGYSFNYRIR